MLKENYQRVKDILITKPEARDNDNILLATIWQDDIDNQGYLNGDVLAQLKAGLLTNFESVRRCRQKIQEQCPELRGKRYKERNEVLEQEVKAETILISNDVKFGWHKEVKEPDLFRN